MVKYVAMRHIFHEPAKATIFVDEAGEEWCRFSVTGTWAGPQDVSKADASMQVDCAEDGSFSITVQSLIPANFVTDSSWLNEQTDLTLCSIEDKLGLDSSTLSSSSCWAGHDSSDLDYLMEEIEQKIVAC